MELLSMVCSVVEEDIYELMTATLGKGEFVVVGLSADSYRAHPQMRNWQRSLKQKLEED